MKVLGVDPGTAVTGYGVVETGNGAPSVGRLIECGVIRCRRRAPLPQRLAELHLGIGELIARHRPDALALESAFYHRNARTTLVLGHARGVILLAAEQAQLAIGEYSPATVKKLVAGSGDARKGEVALMLARLLQLKRPPRPADAADGVAVALTHLLHT